MKEKEDDKGNPAVKTLRQETGFTDVLDPLGGPFYVEALTSDIEQRILNEVDEIERAGGYAVGRRKKCNPYMKLHV